MDEPTMIELPIRGMPKKRPVVTKNGTYMPKRYVEWKEEFVELLTAAIGKHDPIEGNVGLRLEFGSDTIRLQLYATDVPKRVKHMRVSDLDNLVGAVMDALQDHGIIEDDIQVVHLEALIEGEGSDG